jgi:hypothetical protein
LAKGDATSGLEVERRLLAGFEDGGWVHLSPHRHASEADFAVHPVAEISHLAHDSFQSTESFAPLTFTSKAFHRAVRHIFDCQPSIF